MEMLHTQHFPSLTEKQPAYNVVSYSTTSSPSAASSFSDSQDDLLPDLWLETPNPPQCPPAYPVLAPAMLRDVSLEYAHLLLPHSLLAPLTEENLAAQLGRREGDPDLGCAQMHHLMRQLHLVLPAEPRAPAAAAAPDPDFSGDAAGGARLAKRRGSHSLTGLAKGKNINTQLYKTELCVSFMKIGVCPYGTKCQFAHGDEDLKSVLRPANWRSKPCANWSKYGLCRYGKRCCFKHGH